MKYLAAQIACTWYLLTRGMWRSEQRFVAWALNGKPVLVAAVRISPQSGCSTVTRIFYNPHDHPTQAIEAFFDSHGAR